MRALSRAGLCSRAAAEQLVAEGRVAVNGRTVRDPERRVDEARDRLTVDGRAVSRAAPVVVLLHKPADCVTTRSDERGRRTVYDLLGGLDTWVGPVGRLDRATTGLLLLTNDTALAEGITSPDSHLPKMYRALVRGAIDDAALDRLRGGIALDDGPTRPARVERLRTWRGDTLLEIVIVEGRNRQVRRMIGAVGSRVLHLRRIAIGPLRLSGLARGEWRELSAREVAALRRAVEGQAGVRGGRRS